jgi:homoserine dehydrogenase
MLYGRGAGALPTGSAVVGDIISILRNNIDLSPLTAAKNGMTTKKIQAVEENSSGYYIRMNVKDKPGILGEIASILGKHNASILTVTQNVKSEDHVSLVIITHEIFEGNINKAIRDIKGLDNVNSVENIIRIENFS